MLRTHRGRANRAQTIANDVAALQNEQVVHMPENNYGNPSREAKHQRDHFNHMGHWLGRGKDLRCVNQQPWGQRKLASISLFQDSPIIPRTFILAGGAQMSMFLKVKVF